MRNFGAYSFAALLIFVGLVAVNSEACDDQLPSGHCPDDFTCTDYADLEMCDDDWSRQSSLGFNFCFVNTPDLNIPDAKIKDYCKLSCANCPPETCDDGIQNQDETGIDCGDVCPSCDWIERTLVAEEGRHINGANSGKTLEKCKKWCDQTDGCNSIAWQLQAIEAKTGACWLKGMCLTAMDTSKVVGEFKSYYKPCSKKPSAWGTCNDGIQNGYETGTDCGGDNTVILSMIYGVPMCRRCGSYGNDNGCTTANKCRAGEGDCDSHSECEEGLLCSDDHCLLYSQNIGFDWDKTDDCCTEKKYALWGPEIPSDGLPYS